MMNLFEANNRREPIITAVRLFFEGLKLPLPQKTGRNAGKDSDYHFGGLGRRLVFVTPYGFVIRITSKYHTMGFDNPYFIKPLFSRSVGDFMVDIDLGLECPVTKDDAKVIYHMLAEKHNLYVVDGKPQNLCYMPGTDRCFPAVIDLDPCFTTVRPDAVACLLTSVREVKAILEKREKPIRIVDDLPDCENPLITTYQPLRDIITAAWRPDKVYPDREGIKDFKQACVAFKEAGKLLAPWANEENNYCQTTRIAANYAKRVDERYEI